MPETRTCVVCDAPLVQREYELRENFRRRITCSNACRYQRTSNVMLEKGNVAERWDSITSHGRLPLTQGEHALVDPDLADQLSQSSWHVKREATTNYAARNSRYGEPKDTTIYLHQEVLNCPPGTEADHINRNGLDCQRANLRCVSRSQNNSNRRGRKAGRMKGVCYRPHKRANPWHAQIGHEGRHIYLGCFATEEEAARAYDTKARELYGEYALCNYED